MSRGTPALKDKMGWTKLGHKPFKKHKHVVHARDFECTLNAAHLHKTVNSSSSSSSSCSREKLDEEDIKTNLNPGSFTPRKVVESEQHNYRKRQKLLAHSLFKM